MNTLFDLMATLDAREKQRRGTPPKPVVAEWALQGSTNGNENAFFRSSLFPFHHFKPYLKIHFAFATNKCNDSSQALRLQEKFIGPNEVRFGLILKGSEKRF